MLFLNKIVEHKRKEIAWAKKRKPLYILKEETALLGRRNPIFLAALKKTRPVAVIAEIKRRSPSKGLLRVAWDPVRLARQFERSGAAALSVLTDRKFFGGSPETLRKVRVATKLPILRKDFILDEYQVWESRLWGADAVLLIADILSAVQLKRLSRLAKSLGMDSLVEVHRERDLKKALPLEPALVGINNRDLRTFRVDLGVTGRLADRFSKNTFLVSESGIQNHEDLLYLRKFGVRAVLVGESLVRAKNPAAMLSSFRARRRRARNLIAPVSPPS